MFSLIIDNPYIAAKSFVDKHQIGMGNEREYIEYIAQLIISRLLQKKGKKQEGRGKSNLSLSLLLLSLSPSLSLTHSLSLSFSPSSLSLSLSSSPLYLLPLLTFPLSTASATSSNAPVSSNAPIFNPYASSSKRDT
jgi:hypothetical protein